MSIFRVSKTVKDIGCRGGASAVMQPDAQADEPFAHKRLTVNTKLTVERCRFLKFLCICALAKDTHHPGMRHATRLRATSSGTEEFLTVSENRKHNGDKDDGDAILCWGLTW